MKTPTAQPIALPHEPCHHGISDKNWCTICRHAGGDTQAGKMIKAFTPKISKHPYIPKTKKINSQ